MTCFASTLHEWLDVCLGVSLDATVALEVSCTAGQIVVLLLLLGKLFLFDLRA